MKFQKREAILVLWTDDTIIYVETQESKFLTNYLEQQEKLVTA